MSVILRRGVFLLALGLQSGEVVDFAGTTWVDPQPATPAKVTLVRWWTNGCSLCATSAPALARLGKKAAIIAVYHPKPRREVSSDEVRGWAKEIGMPGILAIDPQWKVLDRWMPPDRRSFTSLTFVLDSRSKIRYVHPGGAIEASDEKALDQQIDAVLAEK